MQCRRTIDAGRRDFVTQSTFAMLTAGLGLGAGSQAGAAGPLARAATASPGLDPRGVDSFLDAVAAGSFELHSLVVARHGHIVAGGWYAPYRAQAPHLLYSLSKSFTSTAVGFAVAAGKLHLSDKVVDFFPGQVPPTISANLAALNVEHLLTMSVGMPKDATPVVTREHDWVRTFLAQPIEFQPGSVFLYNSAATYMLSAIVQKVTGQQVNQYLRPRLFAVLGIPEMSWQVCPLGINTGGWGLSATTETLMKFGQFYLQQGRWNDRQLLPQKWVADATRFHIQQVPPADKNPLTDDWYQGYGYQFWRCRHNAFRGDGAFGQFCIVLPDQDAVVAMTSQTMDMQGLLNLVWEHLLPAMNDHAPPEPNAWGHLRQRLAALTLPVPVGTVPAQTLPVSVGTKPSGRPDSVYRIESNSLGVTQLSIASRPDGVRLAFEADGKTHSITSGLGSWHDGETELPGTPPQWVELIGVDRSPRHPAKVAVAGAWTDAQTFEMQWRYYETPHFDIVTVHFIERRIEVTFQNSLTRMSTALHVETRPMLKGIASS
jgi:CubicO group peptidase (beta-lactamase class C family)